MNILQRIFPNLFAKKAKETANANEAAKANKELIRFLILNFQDPGPEDWEKIFDLAEKAMVNDKTELEALKSVRKKFQEHSQS